MLLVLNLNVILGAIVNFLSITYCVKLDIKLTCPSIYRFN